MATCVGQFVLMLWKVRAEIVCRQTGADKRNCQSSSCSCITSTLDKHHSTCQTVYPQFPHSVADTSWGRLAQLTTFCQEQELDLGNEVFPTVAQPPGTLFLPTSTTLPTPVHSENNSRVYFLIVRTTDYCWRSWTSRIAAPYKFHVD